MSWRVGCSRRRTTWVFSGDRRNEVWYDGVGVTIALHNEKITVPWAELTFR
jgi:hypothetical protein